MFWFNSFSQNITVLNESTKEPIPGVVLYNKDKSKSAQTDIDGKVNIDQFNSEERINFQHVGFKTRLLLKRKINTLVYLVEDEQSLEEVVISASKFEQSRREVAQKILSIKAEDISFTNPQTAADLLANSGQVFVQKSQLGGGSPIIRGFSTNRLLLSVDGVRMNTAIFRGGNVQNVISVDPFSIESTEIILGAGSVIYGSDAIGGVMNFYTKKPQFSSSDSLLIRGNAVTRYGSASNEKTGHIDLNLGLKNWSFLTSASYTDFDDLEMGSNGPEDYLRKEYIITQNGQDIVVENDNPELQRFTGYSQWNFMQKASYKPSEKIIYDLGVHYTVTSDFPRYDRLIRRENGELRSAEWYYGPQKWFMGNFQLTKFSSRSNLYDKIKLTAAYQNFKESRIDRNFNEVERRIREENVDALSLNADFEKVLNEKSKISYGFEYLFNNVGSEANQVSIDDNAVEAIATRYPNGSSWQSIAAYFNYKYRPNKKVVIQSGLRYNQIKIDADLTENNTFFNFPFSDANLNTGALTGGLGLTWSPNKNILWKLNATTAFRAPNIDDVGKLFDSEPGSVVVPNPNLKPEYALGGELGLTLNFEKFLTIDLASYYTYLNNALIRRPFTINGQSEIVYDGELSDVLAIQNASKSWIYGFEAGVKINFTDKIKLVSQYSYVGGTEEDENGAEVPVRHVVPAFGNTRLIFDNGPLKLDAFMVYNGELSFDQFAPSQVANDFLYAKDANGNPYSPSWHTLNFRSEYEFKNGISLSATLENITDQRYRPYSSGIASAGRNLILALRYQL